MSRVSANFNSSSSADIRAWCDASRMPGERAELSDNAALMIGAGFLAPAARSIVVRRASTGLPLPGVPGGFSELRRLQRSIAQVEQQLSNPMMPSMVAAVLRNRLNGLQRRRDEVHKSVVIAKGVFASGTRAIRRERRENVYLELEDRERLFGGLLCTPTPNVNNVNYMRKAGSAAIERIAGVVGQVASRASGSQAEQWASQLFSEPTATSGPQREARFVDGYETILFVAGHYYDRIVRNPAWSSDHFAIPRTQVNLHAELAEIAADVIALRSVRVDLDRALRNGGFDQSFADHIAAKEAALRPVWSQLIDRVQALTEVAHVVESAAVELRLLAEYNHASAIDDRIDHLISRAGEREISADNSKRVTEQVRAGEEQLRIYRDVLQGNIARISMSAPMELPERYEPS
ncbi:hypothetical protein HH308_21760 [Gordonia sp. TBRC 11910]|uniref:Uncharacterized protein n=1 Tax=Gordonia asplenii TaxID=2725283 RepID=A0A848L5C9_9ACTN|nr:hypothetical protein [Gordonia asplenii]NMO03843.1 hypothetical protein [Gordonia asplenii]